MKFATIALIGHMQAARITQSNIVPVATTAGTTDSLPLLDPLDLPHPVWVDKNHICRYVIKPTATSEHGHLEVDTTTGEETFFYTGAVEHLAIYTYFKSIDGVETRHCEFDDGEIRNYENSYDTVLQEDMHSGDAEWISEFDGTLHTNTWSGWSRTD